MCTTFADIITTGNYQLLTFKCLKNILSHLEVPFKSKDKKSILIGKLKEVIGACKCNATNYDWTVIYSVCKYY